MQADEGMATVVGDRFGEPRLRGIALGECFLDLAPYATPPVVVLALRPRPAPGQRLRLAGAQTAVAHQENEAGIGERSVSALIFRLASAHP